MKPKASVVDRRIRITIERLKEFLDSKSTLELVTEKVSAADWKLLKKRAGLPPSYLAFLEEFGFISVNEIDGFEREGLIGFFYPQFVEHEATSFQRMSDEGSDDCYCFSPVVDLGKGEFEVLTFQHDREFEVPKKRTKNSIDFTRHLELVVQDFIKTFEGES